MNDQGRTVAEQQMINNLNNSNNKKHLLAEIQMQLEENRMRKQMFRQQEMEIERDVLRQQEQNYLQRQKKLDDH
jgi:hypothetical protein